MKKTTLFICSLLVATFAFSQKVIDLSNIDFLGKRAYSQDEFYLIQKQNDSIYTFIETKNYNNKEPKATPVSSKQLKGLLLIPTKDMKKMSIKQWDKLLGHNTFLVSKNSEKLTTLTKHSKHGIGIATYNMIGNGKSVDTLAKHNFPYQYTNVKLYDYHYLQLADNKHILMLEHNNGWKSTFELIVPLQDSLYVMGRHKKIAYNAGYKGNEEDNGYYTQHVWAQDFYRIRKNEVTNKTEMLNSKDDNPAGIVADKINLNYGTIITYNEDTKLYDGYTTFGKKLPFKNVRLIKTNYFVPPVLAGNDLLFLDYNMLVADAPNLDDRISELASSSASRDDQYVLHLGKGEDEKLEFKVNINGNREDIFTLQNNEDIDSLLFVNGKSIANHEGTNLDYMTEKTFFVKKKSGKWNIATFELSYENKTFTVTDQLAQDCDSIQPTYPTIFGTDGLVGFFPEMKEAKYKSLENKNYKLLRYEKPSGEKGWLDLSTMTEYADM